MSFFCPILKFIFIIFVVTFSFTSSLTRHNFGEGVDLHEHYSRLEIPQFRTLNRRSLAECPLISPYLNITTSVSGLPLSDEQNVTVTVSGVTQPSDEDWVAMISPSHSSVENCLLHTVLYKETGDFSNLPLLCHYPVKAAYLKSDPDYVPCKNSQCKKQQGGHCLVTTCTASLTFHVVNIRTDIEFVLFHGGFHTPCISKRSQPLQFSNPRSPLYAHLSSVDSTATKIRVTWVSGDSAPQQVKYQNGKSQASTVTTFTQNDMCGGGIVKSAAQDFGWHDPGYIHTAILTGLQPSTSFSFKYGSDAVGWSNEIQARMPPAGGANEVKFIVFGDMGKAPLDVTVEHYIQPGSLSVAAAVADEVAAGNVDMVMHIGDISYATGFMVEWDYFLQLIEPIASHVPYMTAIGNHERDYIEGGLYRSPDSGGECGVPYEAYFPMPNPSNSKDKPWYSIEQGPVHFTVISTEHDWKPTSDQYKWMQEDMASVDRSKTPWLIFAGHRPMYTSMEPAVLNADPLFVGAVEPLLVAHKADLALFGHVHNYERTCAMYGGQCLAMPVKDRAVFDTYDYTNYSAPVHLILGMAGFTLDKFPPFVLNRWSISRISKYGYVRIHATRNELKLEFVNSSTRQVEDSFRIIKN